MTDDQDRLNDLRATARQLAIVGPGIAAATDVEWAVAEIEALRAQRLVAEGERSRLSVDAWQRGWRQGARWQRVRVRELLAKRDAGSTYFGALLGALLADDAPLIAPEPSP